MDTNLTPVIATERQERYRADAAQRRRSRSSRSHKTNEPRPAPSRRRRVGFFFKELAAASL
jgi:hypothetical protein